MMGEYLLYYNNVLFGGIYDDRLLVKKTSNNKKYKLEESIPYTNAKPMYLIDSDDTDLIKDIHDLILKFKNLDINNNSDKNQLIQNNKPNF